MKQEREREDESMVLERQEFIIHSREEKKIVIKIFREVRIMILHQHKNNAPLLIVSQVMSLEVSTVKVQGRTNCYYEKTVIQRVLQKALFDISRLQIRKVKFGRL